jgi:alkaline phosphatase D
MALTGGAAGDGDPGESDAPGVAGDGTGGAGEVAGMDDAGGQSGGAVGGRGGVMPGGGRGRVDRRAFMAGVVAAALAGAGAAACSGGDGDDRDEGGGNRRRGDGQDAAGGGGRQGDDGPPVPDDLPAQLFRLGVASGDPRPGSVILWTRLVADPFAADGGLGTVDPVPVHWEVATDDELRDVVASGRTTAEAALGHSVHVDADGLEPGTWYWYRFTVGRGDDARVSPVGRTRTAPAEGDDARSLRFAFASCQNRQQGFWGAHTHLAQEDLDLVVFLGDYIYEEDPNERSAQPYRSPKPVDLPTYRQRWAEYKADAGLQAAHRQFPWVVTWDDHEVDNDYAGDIPEDTDEDDAAAREAFLDLRAAAYQAYYEHMPLRLDPPQGPDLRIHRELAWGSLARLFVLDTRQHRSDQACLPVVSSAGPLCAEAREESRTMMGEEQEDWLEGALARTDATWNVLAQQVVMSAVPLTGDIVNLDGWDGYPAARRRLVDQLRQVRNPVIVTGDIHLSAVGTLTDDPDDPATAPVAAELVGTSISSTFPLPDLVEELPQTLANVYYAEARRRGYVVCTVTPDDLRAEFRYVSTVESAEADIETGATWRIREGDPTPLEV